MTIITVALNGNSAGLANGMLECGDGLLLRRGRAGHVEDFFLHDCAVQVVGAVTEGNLRERQASAHPVGSEMIDVIEKNAAHCEVAQLFDGRRSFDVGQNGGLRLERERNKTAEAGSFILKSTKLAQMVDSLLNCFDVSVKHRTSAAAAHSMPGAMDVEPLLGRFFPATNSVAHGGIENFRAAASDRSQSVRSE